MGIIKKRMLKNTIKTSLSKRRTVTTWRKNKMKRLKNRYKKSLLRMKKEGAKKGSREKRMH